MGKAAVLISLALATLGGCKSPSSVTPQGSSVRRAVVGSYAAIAYEVYSEAEHRATAMADVIEEFLESPTPESLAAARAAWVHARVAYGPSEVFRFYGGPIDDPQTGVELLVNAWPIDEAYVDAVRDNTNSGIINNPSRYPSISATILALLNERGGEANVSCGWHAIEFLLWGQDFDDSGPGSRPATDYVLGVAENAERRREYLSAVTGLLCEHLRQVREAWAPDRENYRATFEAADPDESIGKVLAGMAVLMGFEMSGERLAVAFETRDQEDEHSCFSDTTHLDLEGNARGVEAVYTGRFGTHSGPGVRDLVAATDPAMAEELDACLSETLRAVRAIPSPFDQAIGVTASTAERQLLLEAIEALEVHALALASLGHELGYQVPLRPGG